MKIIKIMAMSVFFNNYCLSTIYAMNIEEQTFNQKIQKGKQQEEQLVTQDSERTYDGGQIKQEKTHIEKENKTEKPIQPPKLQKEKIEDLIIKLQLRINLRGKEIKEHEKLEIQSRINRLQKELKELDTQLSNLKQVTKNNQSTSGGGEIKQKKRDRKIEEKKEELEEDPIQLLNLQKKEIEDLKIKLQLQIKLRKEECIKLDTLLNKLREEKCEKEDIKLIINIQEKKISKIDEKLHDIRKILYKDSYKNDYTQLVRPVNLTNEEVVSSGGSSISGERSPLYSYEDLKT